MNKLKELRQEQGLTQEVLAKKVKISTDHLKKIERGERNLSYSLASRIAKELNCNTTDIFLK